MGSKELGPGLGTQRTLLVRVGLASGSLSPWEWTCVVSLGDSISKPSYLGPGICCFLPSPHQISGRHQQHPLRAKEEQEAVWPTATGPSITRRFLTSSASRIKPLEVNQSGCTPPPPVLIATAKEIAAHRADPQQGWRPGCGTVGGRSHPDAALPSSICRLGCSPPGPAFCVPVE